MDYGRSIAFSRRREREERAAAEAASDPVMRAIHLELAEHFADRTSSDEEAMQYDPWHGASTRPKPDDGE